jgi:integrase/recombinase XerC/integrase/recombinase XerD
VSELADLTINNIHISDDNSYLRIIGKGTVNRTMSLNKATREAIEDYLKARKESKSDRLLIGQRGPVGRGAYILY